MLHLGELPIIIRAGPRQSRTTVPSGWAHISGPSVWAPRLSPWSSWRFHDGVRSLLKRRQVISGDVPLPRQVGLSALDWSWGCKDVSCLRPPRL